VDHRRGDLARSKLMFVERGRRSRYRRVWTCSEQARANDLITRVDGSWSWAAVLGSALLRHIADRVDGGRLSSD
jgi:hypothetical protein